MVGGGKAGSGGGAGAGGEPIAPAGAVAPATPDSNGSSVGSGGGSSSKGAGTSKIRKERERTNGLGSSASGTSGKGGGAGSGGSGGMTVARRLRQWQWWRQRWMLAVLLTSCLGFVLLSRHNSRSRGGGRSRLAMDYSDASFDPDRGGGLPSDLLQEVLDDWDHIGTRTSSSSGGGGGSGSSGSSSSRPDEPGGTGATAAADTARHGGSGSGGGSGGGDIGEDSSTPGQTASGGSGAAGAALTANGALMVEEVRVTPLKERAAKSIIKIAEDAACAVPRPLVRCRLPMRERIHIVFVSAMWQREATTKRETYTMLKSILYGTRCPLHLHFLVSGEPEVSTLNGMMASIDAANLVPVPPPGVAPLPEAGGPHPARLQGPLRAGYWNDTRAREVRSRAVAYSLHYIPADWVVERAKALHLYPLDHHAGVPGMSKFFMADILWQVPRALYLDVDMLLAGDVQDLYDYFSEMDKDPKLLLFMSNNHPEGHNRRRWLRPYCSCQMVLDFDRMRKANLTKLFESTLRGHKPRDLADYVKDGDQFLFTRTCKEVAGVCRILPRLWNVSGCTKPIPFLGLSDTGREAGPNGTCWRAVHFNCMGHSRGRRGKYAVPPEWARAHAWANGLTLAQAARHGAG